MSVQPPVEHMPWQQANREYDDGYNAGIAAAACLLKKRAAAMSIELIPFEYFPFASSKIAALRAAADAVLAMMRPEREAGKR